MTSRHRVCGSTKSPSQLAAFLPLPSAKSQRAASSLTWFFFHFTVQCRNWHLAWSQCLDHCPLTKINSGMRCRYFSFNFITFLVGAWIFSRKVSKSCPGLGPSLVQDYLQSVENIKRMPTEMWASWRFNLHSNSTPHYLWAHELLA